MKRMLNGLFKRDTLGMEFSKPAHNAKSSVVAGMAGEAGQRKTLDSQAVSIVMGTYQAEPFLKEQLDSIVG